MQEEIHPESGLVKSVWTDDDFESMGWHDATVHALCVQPGEGVLPRLVLDLDYIVRWVHPVPPAVYFSFWVAPVTLVFDEVWDLAGDLDFRARSLCLEIADLHRETPDGVSRGFSFWRIEGHAFELKFYAPGFRQYFRRAPALVPGQVLSHAERGGCSFAEAGFH
ncbi:hypothetical protein ACFC06_22315 [Nocardia sp. NPDC056064]|uniref:hypothetical protein n=1 Tax=Nocardia sp. NPDC056064 TaxID=3345701 RepID=UPI0035D7AD06